MALPRIALGVVIAVALGAGGCGLMGSRAHRVELNTAARKDLAALPGLDKSDADRIIAARPYKSKRGLIGKLILTDSQFEKVKDLVYVEHESGD